MLKLKSNSIDQTCPACPSQWEAETIDGRFVYVRYRWGTLRVDVSDSRDDWSNGDRDEHYRESFGDPLDGAISWHDVKERADIIEV